MKSGRVILTRVRNHGNFFIRRGMIPHQEVGSVNKLSGMTALVKGLTNGLGWVSGRGTITLVGDRLVGLVV